jgi:secreted PhoX family phosphatase
MQFGTHNDFIAFLPLPRGSANSEHGLLCVNHEYSELAMLFPRPEGACDKDNATREEIQHELAAQGHSVAEIRRVEGQWQLVRQSPRNRRLTALTPMRFSGPAAGHERLRTRSDPEGRRVLGTFDCCSGGTTPWGTVLIGEENVNKRFQGDPGQGPEARNHQRMDCGTELEYGWYRFHERFQLKKEPREPNRYGWVVEYDPYDPQSVPTKRTALGRFKHEGATTTLDASGRVVVYMGDDDEFEFLYRYVSRERYEPSQPERNALLLDEGTLSVARFEADGSLRWLPLIQGTAPLDAAHGFASQADVLIEARTAATLLGATPMDRPEDVETNPVSGRVYVMLTNNRLRKEADPANPRVRNLHGHVLELIPPQAESGGHSHAADAFRWEILLQGGPPQKEREAGLWLSCPDNCTFDPSGGLWISTDGMARNEYCDGLFAVDLAGERRGTPRLFFRAPIGAEVCGPCFTPDGSTLFLAVQHPGDADAKGSSKGVHYNNPPTRFPDFDPKIPPRSSVVAIQRS